MSSDVFILGGWQSDFAAKVPEGDLFSLISSATVEGLHAARVAPDAVDVVHVANLAGELFNGQAHAGAMVAAVHPDLDGLPASRHEAACASGTVAALSAMAELEGGRYDVALLVGAEVLRNVPGAEAGRQLGCAAWIGREVVGAPYPWPALFGRVADEYGERFGLDHRHLGRISEINFANARLNPNAQTRRWTMDGSVHYEDDARNPLLSGHLRKADVCPVTDGSVGIVLASARFTDDWCRHNGIVRAQVPRILGWGHTTSNLLLEDRLLATKGQDVMFPHLRRAIEDSYRRAGISGPAELDAVELHDCTTITEYVALEHLGLAAAGEAWKLVEGSVIDRTGSLPVNPGGGLLGGGHPVGATGLRMLLDAAKQVTATAGEYQVEGATRVAVLNLGGSFATAVSLVIGTDPN